MALTSYYLPTSHSLTCACIFYMYIGEISNLQHSNYPTDEMFGYFSYHFGVKLRFLLPDAFLCIGYVLMQMQIGMIFVVAYPQV